MASCRIVGYCRLQQLKMNFFNPYHCEPGPAYVYPEYLMNNLASTSGVGYQHQESSPPPPPPPPQPDKKPVISLVLSLCCVSTISMFRKRKEHGKIPNLRQLHVVSVGLLRDLIIITGRG